MVLRFGRRASNIQCWVAPVWNNVSRKGLRVILASLVTDAVSALIQGGLKSQDERL